MTVLIKNVQNELIMALALLLLGASTGYNVSDHSNVITIDSDFDSYQDKAEEVNILMQDVILNPGNYDLGAVQDKIFYEYYPWAERHSDSRQGTFVAYLEACNQVVIGLSNGEQVDTTEMDQLYRELNLDTQISVSQGNPETNLKIDTPFLWVAGVPSINA